MAPSSFNGRTHPTPTANPQTQMERMSAMFARIDLMEVAANRTYHLVLERYPKSAKLLRSYGRFLENVKNDPWGAAKYYSEAEKQVHVCVCVFVSVCARVCACVCACVRAWVDGCVCACECMCW
jgi:hypothetical protein